MLYIRCLLVFLLSLPVFVVAQHSAIRGVIRDAHTQEPIPYASVYLKAAGVGKLSDSNGYFHLKPNNIPVDTLVVSYVGYQMFKITLNALVDTLPMEIYLLRAINNAEVVVKARFNKGLFLWRKILSKKQLYNHYNLHNFSYEAYNKLEIDIKNFTVSRIKNNLLLKPFAYITKPLEEVVDTSGALPAYLIESISNFAYQRNPQKIYENIIASNTRGLINESTGRLLGVLKQNVNIYTNYISILNKDFISPFNDNADRYYRFSVPDTQMVNGNKIFHFVFHSRHSGQNTFEGDAWVESGSFHIQKITLYLGKEANLNYINRISIFQEFQPISDSSYFLKRDKFFADFSALGKKSVTLIGKKTTSYKKVVTNNDSITVLFSKQPVKEWLLATDGFTKKTDADWNLLRHDSLLKREQVIYATIDTLVASPRYRQMQDNFKLLGSGYKTVGNFEVGRWFSLFSGNQLEGFRFRVDAGTTKSFNKQVYLHGYLAYGTKDEKLKGQAEAYWVIRRNPQWLRLHLSYTNDIDIGVKQYGQAGADNVFALAVRKQNSTRKFLQTKNIRVEILKEWGRGFSTELFVGRQQFNPLLNLPDKNNFLVSEGEPLNNIELAIKFRWAYLEEFIASDFFRISTGTRYPIIEVLLAKGIPGLFNSAYHYNKYAISVRDELKIPPLGIFIYKGYAGKIKGRLPFTLLENHPGNDLYYYGSGAFNLMYRFEYLSDQYAGINMEHQIGSGLFRFLPITRKLKCRQFWNLKTLWGTLSNENKQLNNTTNFFKTLNGKTYMEVGTGIDNIFKILRFDIVWRVLPRPLPVYRASRFGVFGSLQFKF